MKNALAKALAEIAQRETKLAILDGNYSWAIVCALVQACMTEASG